MKIRILHQVSGAKEARGVAVIIDVFRAFSVEAYLISQGVKALYPVGDMRLAYAAKEKDPSVLLVGERHGIKLPGFDFGNSPSEFEGLDLTGRTVYHTTSAGTQGVANASGADEILTGSLVNARAVAAYLRRKDPEEVSLVAMGLEGKCNTEEDEFCAEYIRSLLENEPMSEITVKNAIENFKKTSGAKFFDPSRQDVFPARDFELCTQIDRFDFVLRIEPDETGQNRSVKIG